jgi:hypothetical protein
MIGVAYICNVLCLFQFVNLVFMLKQRYSHLNKRLNNWIIGTVSRPISIMNENERRIRTNRATDDVIITPLHISSVGNIGGT